MTASATQNVRHSLHRLCMSRGYGPTTLIFFDDHELVPIARAETLHNGRVGGDDEIIALFVAALFQNAAVGVGPAEGGRPVVHREVMTSCRERGSSDPEVTIQLV